MKLKFHCGFTLLELMITVVIVAILASVAVPSYLRHVQSSRREMAKSALLDAAQRMESFYALNFTYVGADSNGVPTIFPNKVPKDGTDNYYTLSVSGASRTSYSIIATPTTGSSQTSDVCGTLSLDRTGNKTATGNSSNCW